MRTPNVVLQSHRSLCLASLLNLLVFGWAAHPACADLSVQGGTPQQRTAVETLYQLAMPEKFLRTEVLRVRLLPDAAMNASIHDDFSASGDDERGTIDGITQEAPPEILLRASRPAPDLEAVFVHEYGHVIWATALSPGQRTIFQRIYAVDRDEHHLVSEYAEASPEEGFAEAFGFLILRPKQLAECDPRSYAFLTALIIPDRKQFHAKEGLQRREWEERDASR